MGGGAPPQNRPWFTTYVYPLWQRCRLMGWMQNIYQIYRSLILCTITTFHLPAGHSIEKCAAFNFLNRLSLRQILGVIQSLDLVISDCLILNLTLHFQTSQAGQIKKQYTIQKLKTHLSNDNFFFFVTCLQIPDIKSNSKISEFTAHCQSCR